MYTSAKWDILINFFCLVVIDLFFYMVPVIGVNADKVGIEAAEMLLANLRHGGAVDEYLQDQVMTLLGEKALSLLAKYLVIRLDINLND